MINNQSLLQYLSDAFRGIYSGKQLKRAVDSGFCFVNGKVERFSSRRLKKSDVVLFRKEGIINIEKKSALQTIFEDDEMIVLHKPSGMDVKKIQELYDGKAFLAHRLDKPTSGVLILAKTAAMRDSFEDLFRTKRISKYYVAWVNGVVKEDQGKIESQITCKSHYDGQKIMGIGKGSEAITHWKVLKRVGKVTFISLVPLTGKTHQLRVHMASIGHPILGDYQYSKSVSSEIYPRRLLLHAKKVMFIHPKTQRPFTFQAPFPKDFVFT